MAGALGTPVKGHIPPDTRTSSPMNTAVGSGSRPGVVKYPIATSAPKDQRTLDRDPPGGYLK